jgi:hypothetical protein
LIFTDTGIHHPVILLSANALAHAFVFCCVRPPFHGAAKNALIALPGDAPMLLNGLNTLICYVSRALEQITFFCGGMTIWASGCWSKTAREKGLPSWGLALELTFNNFAHYM